MKKQHGFALSLDAVGVIIFMLILAAIVLVKGSSFVNEGRVSRAAADTAALGGYISEYKMEIGAYPASLTDLTQTNGQYGPWILKVPKDPWNNDYQYRKTDDKFVVYSFGSDESNSGSSAANGVAKNDIGFAGR